MTSINDILPIQITDFLVVAIFSLLIGLMQRRLHPNKEENLRLGSDRTFSFIGILSYILLIADPQHKILFIAGGIILGIILSIFYYNRIQIQKDFGITTILIALLTYALPLLIVSQPFWLYLLVAVTIILFTEMKTTFKGLSQKFDQNETVTLSKFIIIAGVILPIVPDIPFVDYLKITPYKIWLAVVVISSISYVSYLLQKFILKKSGYLLTGILGGLYSSTATTVVLARKTKNSSDKQNQIVAAIILASMMMYLRVLALVFIFNTKLAVFMTPYLGIMIVVTGLTGILLFYMDKGENTDNSDVKELTSKHPLELKVAIIFTLIYVAVAFIIHFVSQYFGNHGLSILSFLVGIADIDPFLLNMFQGESGISMADVTAFSFHAIISNNLMKMLYAIFLGHRNALRWSLIGFLSVTLINVILLFFL